MTRSALAGLLLLTIVGCAKKDADAPTADLPAKSQLLVIHTQTAVLSYPIAVGADEWKAELAQSYPATCIDEDADNDGVPASMDADEEQLASNEPYHCRPCGSANDFQMELRGESVELDHARITERRGDVLTLQSPFGAIYARVDEHTNAAGSLNPGAVVQVTGERDRQSPWDTVSAQTISVTCEAPAVVSALNLVGATAVRIAERSEPPFSSQSAVLAAR